MAAQALSYDISGDAPIEVRDSPALDAIATIEKLKAEAAALAKTGDWRASVDKYDEVVKACDASGAIVAADFEAERVKERCYLQCLCNRSLCYYKLQEYEKAKELAQTAIDAHAKSRVVDDSGLAKCLFRRGQASLGLKDSRSAVDSIAEAIRIEEAQLAKGAPINDATMKAMQRELLRARHAAKADAKAASSKLKAQMGGFLKAGSKTLGDPKKERRELAATKIDCALKYVLEKGDKAKDDERIAPNYDKMIGDLVAARHEACSAKDTSNELSLTFAEGFVAFVASAPEADAGPDAEKYYARCADAIQSYWHLREELARTTADESELAPPCGIGDVAALECCAHSLMQLRRAGQARPFFEAYVEKADQAGPLMAYHNLPDSFLLQRGLPKMSDPDRRVSRWKHRAHAPRALFDGRTALCAICSEAGDIEDAIAHAEAALGHAAEDDEKLTAHKNMAFVLRKRADADGSSTKDEDLERAAAHENHAAAVEEAMKAKGEKVDEKTNRVEGSAAEDAFAGGPFASGSSEVQSVNADDDVMAEEVSAEDGGADE